MSIYKGSQQIKDVYYGNNNSNKVTYIPEDIKFEVNPRNVVPTGSPSVSAGVIGNFSRSNYVKTNPAQFSDYTASAGSWEWVFKFTYQTSSATQTIYAQGAQYETKLYIHTTGKLGFSASNSTSSYNICDMGGKTVLAAGNTYWVKVTFNGSEYALWLSTNGVNYSWETGYTSSTKITARGTWAIGVNLYSADSWKYEYPFKGTIDVSQSYIKINGSYWWKGGDGSITLKKGSKIYDGAGNAYVMEKDIKQICRTSSTKPLWVVLNFGSLAANSSTCFEWNAKADCYSGATPPTSAPYMWYDTVNKKVLKSDREGSEMSLPIAACSANGFEITGIYGIANGLFYIGQLQYLLPGFRCLPPDGLTANGRRKVKEYTVPHLITRQITYAIPDGGQVMFLRTDTNTLESCGNNSGTVLYYEQSSEPTKVLHAYWWNTSDNYMRRCYNDSSGNLYWGITPQCKIGTFTNGSDYRITGIDRDAAQPAKVCRKVARVYKGSQLLHRSQVNWETPKITSLSQDGYTLTGSTTTNLNTLFSWNAAPTYRWGQGVDATSKWFRITFPFKVKITKISVWQGFAGSHDDSRCYNVRFYASTSASNPISNRTTLNWNVSSQTDIPLTAWPETNVVYCQCNMQSYGTLSAVRMWGIRYDV